MNTSSKTYTIAHKEQTTVTIGENILHELSKLLAPYNHSGFFIICDTTTERLFLPKIVELLRPLNATIVSYTLPEGEKGKSMDNLTNIFTNMLTNNLARKSAVIALGGGVVGDVTTFAAGLYLRGIDCIQIPTTLLAQVDSALGGKGAINIEGLKNMIGIIRQPRLVVADTALLISLPKEQLRSGMGEVVKYAIAFDKELFSLLNDNVLSSLNLSNIVKRSIDIKMRVVEKDPLDTTETRAKVNFGHTLGHAIELSSGLSHGKAVAVGMVFAIKLSQKLSLLLENTAEDAIALIKKYELPISVKDVDKNKVLSLMSKDKKAVKGNVSFVLLKDIGETVVQNDVPQALIEETFSEVVT